MRQVMISVVVLLGCASTHVEEPFTAPDIATPDTTAVEPDSGPAPSTCATTAVTSSQLLGAEADSNVPGRQHAAACGRIVWATPEGGLNIYNTSSGATEALLPAGSGARWPAVGEAVVVASVGTPPQIQRRSLTGGPWTALDPTASPQLRPRILGDRVAWEDERQKHAQIRVFDLETMTASWVEETEADQRFVVLGQGRVVWTDFRSDANMRWDGDGSDDADLWSSNFTTHTALVEAPRKQAFPEIDGDRIVWMDWRNLPRPEPKLAWFEVWTGTLAADGVAAAAAIAAVSEGSYHALPTIDGTRVAWEGRSPSGDHAILGLDLAAPGATPLALTPAGASAYSPFLTGEALVFRDLAAGSGLTVAPSGL